MSKKARKKSQNKSENIFECKKRNGTITRTSGPIINLTNS